MTNGPSTAFRPKPRPKRQPPALPIDDNDELFRPRQDDELPPLDDNEAAELSVDDRKTIEEIKKAITLRKIAVAELAAESFIVPVDDGSLDDQYNDPAAEPDFIVGPRVLPRMGIVQINAQWKAGKTTLASVNLACDLASGAPFLGEYPVHFPAGGVAIWNLEVGAGTLQQWLFARGLSAAARRRIHPKHLRGSGINLQLEEWASWTVEWLRDRNIKVWIIDPLSKLYAGKENDASEFNAWWLALEGIARRAAVDLVIIVHHTGHGTAGEGDALPRGRGSSAMQGNPDVIYSYRHGGNLGEPPPDGDSRRYFAGFGRDVELREITLDFDQQTKRLTVVRESNGRAADKVERNAQRVADIVWAAADRIKTGDLKGQLAPLRDEHKVAALNRAVASGWIAVTEEGNTKWHERGSVDYRIVRVGGLSVP